MEKYKPIQHLMVQGEFRKALDHLERILKKNPGDKEAVRLEYLCREMIHIHSVCTEQTEQRKEISVSEYLSVHFRRIMGKICHVLFCLLNKLPEKWQKKVHADRFRVWEISFSIESDSEKDFVWESLFWDKKRRITVFASLIAVLLVCTTLFFVLMFGEKRDSELLYGNDFRNIVQLAYEGDAHGQFLMGKKFYYGEDVKQDIDQALLWLTKSARSGHTQAAELLQKILVEQDIRVNEGKYLWAPNKKDPQEK